MGKPEENETAEAVLANSVDDADDGGLSEPLLPHGSSDGSARRRRRAAATPSAPSPDAHETVDRADEPEEGGEAGGGSSWWESAAREFASERGGEDQHDGAHDHAQHYDGTFVPPPPIVPVAEPVPSDPNMVRIVAPAAYAAGYEFVATLEDGRAFTVTVEEEVVDEGDEMSVPYPREFLATTVVPPSGHWKDGLCACLRFGCCHPTVCLPWFFPFVALGQIMTRMRLTFLANPGPRSRTKHTFKILVCLALLRLSIATAFGAVPGWRINSLVNEILGGIAVALVVLQIYLTATTRRRIRERYDIPPNGACCGCCGCCRGCCGDCFGCGGCCEDICRAAVCGCCTLAQMGRHTADYETYRGVCCTSTGLPPAAPEV